MYIVYVCVSLSLLSSSVFSSSLSLYLALIHSLTHTHTNTCTCVSTYIRPTLVDHLANRVTSLWSHIGSEVVKRHTDLVNIRGYVHRDHILNLPKCRVLYFEPLQFPAMLHSVKIVLPAYMLPTMF